MACKTKIHGIVGIKDFNPNDPPISAISQNKNSPRNFYFGGNMTTIDENNAQEILLKQ